MDRIILTNPDVVRFYQQHPQFNPDAINHAFVTFYETHFTGNQDIPNNLANDILGKITQLDATVHSKMYELKQSYLDDLRSFLELHTNANFIKIMDKIDQDHIHMAEKTQQMIHSLLPANRVQFQSEYDQIVRAFKEDILKLSESTKTDVSMDKIQLVLTEKYSQLFNQIQQQVFSHLNLSENRIQQQLGEIKHLSSVNRTFQENQTSQLTTFINQFKVSQKKGEFGENRLFQTLTQMFPSSEIINTSGQTSSGDFMLKRPQKPVILLETKHYSDNASKKEVDKFLFDIETQQCHGIFMSQTSGIALKQNYEINFHQGHVLVFVHHVHYDPEKIMIACDIIDQLSDKIKENGGESVPYESLVAINQQYQAFLEKRDRIITQMNINHKKTVADITELSMDELGRALSAIFTSVKSNKESETYATETDASNHRFYRCLSCTTYITTNERSIKAHLPQCKKRKLARTQVDLPI